MMGDISMDVRSEHPLSRARYFTVSTGRFVLYEIVSLGLWSYYWFYRNWEFRCHST